MPVDPHPGFRPPFWLRDPHWQTIWPTLFRRIGRVPWRRERLEVSDGDFLDLDWWASGQRRLVILSHGLEGNARRPYMAGMARAFWVRRWDVVSWNFRGCSGESNRLCRSYHSGATEDLAAVVTHALSRGGYDRAALVGFSLGGNLTLKYACELAGNPGLICGAAGVSVPCDLQAAAEQMEGPECSFYMRRFLRDMGDKMRVKARQFPGRLNLSGLTGMTTFRQFDDAFTAPLHGFRDAQDYWDQCSCGPRLGQIRIPTILVNAADDPFLAPACFPSTIAAASPWLHLSAPPHGGHVGFVPRMSRSREYWSEMRVASFLTAAAEGQGLS